MEQHKIHVYSYDIHTYIQTIHILISIACFWDGILALLCITRVGWYQVCLYCANSKPLPPIILILRIFKLKKTIKISLNQTQWKRGYNWECTIVTNMSIHFLSLDTNMYKSNSTHTTVCIQGDLAFPLIYSTDFCNIFKSRQLQTPNFTVCGLVRCFSINQ